MFVPQKKEIKKLQKKKIRFSANNNTSLSFGYFGLKIKENSFITSSQLEMIRVFLTKQTKKVGKF
jgi:ribosomal protein L16/L10AE